MAARSLKFFSTGLSIDLMSVSFNLEFDVKAQQE